MSLITASKQEKQPTHHWYQRCVDYHMSVPRYRQEFDPEMFEERAACASIYRLAEYYRQKPFKKDSGYLIRMDHLLEVIREHETEKEMAQWRVWLKYFVTMGAGEWNEFWQDFLNEIRGKK